MLNCLPPFNAQLRICRVASTLAAFAIVFGGVHTSFAAGATATPSDSLPPVKLHVFVSATVPADAVKGLSDSAADFKKAADRNFSGHMRLVDTHAEADVSIEIKERKRELFVRSVGIRVHHRGGTPAPLYSFSTQGGFADVATGLMGVIGAWSQQHHRAVVGLDSADVLRQTPPDVYHDIKKLRAPDAAVRANAAQALGNRGMRASVAVTDLKELLADMVVLTTDSRGRAYPSRDTLFRVGVIAGFALVRIGAAGDLYAALSSDPRENARMNAATALAALHSQRTVTALEATARDDSSAKVREAAAEALQTMRRAFADVATRTP